MKRMIKLLSFAAVLVLTQSAPALAGDSGVPMPKHALPEGKCVEDTQVMRRNHMEYLKHHRDETMHRGIRTKQHSLKECINCHVPEQQAEAGEQKDHFCQSCHSYAGVTIDCFQCHATKPEKSALFHPIVTPGMERNQSAHQADSAELLNRLAKAKQDSDSVGASK